MFFTRKTFISALLIASLSLAGLSHAQTPATPAAPASTPTVLAVINIVDLFNGLIEKTEGEQAIENIKKDLENNGNALSQKIDDLKKGLSAYKAGTAEYKKVQDDLLKATMDYQSYSSYAQQVLLLELLNRKAVLYKKMNDAVKKYAQDHGIAIVFVADSGSTEGMSSPDQLTEMIQMRKILYFNPGYDITLAVQQAMNTDYQLSKSATAPNH